MQQRQLLPYLFAALVLNSQHTPAQQTTPATTDSTINLQAVEIKGQKRHSLLVENSTKKLNINNSPSSFSATAAEAIRQIPSFFTDIEGNTFFRGSNQSLVLFNNIPYGLLEENRGDIFIQMPAFFFNRIELSAAPSIQQLPDGSGSTVSFNSATDDKTTLLLDLGAGMQERYNAGGQLQVQQGKWNITGKYNYRREYRERSFYKLTTTPAGLTEMDNNATARPDVHIADLHVGYQLSSNDRLSVYGLYYLMDYSRYGGIHNTKKDPLGDILNQMIRHRYNNQNQQAYAVEARWQHTFRKPGEILSIWLNYNDFAYDEDNHFENEKAGTGKIIAQDNLFVNQDKHQYYMAIFYHRPFVGNWQLDAGYHGRFKKDKYAALAENLTDGDWLPNQSKSADFRLERNTHLLYVSLSRNWKKLKVEAGIQGEISNQQTQEQNEGKRSQTHFHAYPQVRIQYLTNATDKLVLSYLQRTDRPLTADLNPFVDRSDLTYIKQGNPMLKPEYIHLLELSYNWQNSYFHFTPDVYYRRRTNRIMDIASTQENEVVWKKENIGHTQTIGFEITGLWTPWHCLSIGASGNIYRDEIDGRSIGFSKNKTMNCWDVKGNISASLSQTTQLQIDGFYLSDQLTVQGKIKSRYAVNAGISQYFMRRKLRANLSINDIFDSLGEKTIIDTQSLQQVQIRKRDSQVAWFTLTYQL